MKVLLVCAGGMSTSILMKKMSQYAEQKGFELEIIAVGIGEYGGCYQKYDVILLGPQVSYKLKAVEEETGKPVGVMAPYDYAIGNAENIFKQVDKLLQK